MKPTTYTLLLLFFISSCKKPLIPPTGFGTSQIPWIDSSTLHPNNDAYRKLIVKYNKLGLPGIALLINDRYGTWIGSVGKADIKNNIDFAPCQVSKVASITKLMIGSLVFLMMEDSVNTNLRYSDLNRKISNWLPESILKNVPNGSLATLGQLMNHESGIPDVAEENDFYLEVLNKPNKLWTQTELLKFVSGTPAVFNPGDTAIYSNTNTLLLAMIIDKISGRNHADLLRERVIDRLGLTSTFYHPNDALPDYTAQGYYDLYRNHTLINVSNFMTGNGAGYNGVYSNVVDLYHFLDALLISKTLLSQASLNTMMRTGKSDGTNRYGYGIMKKFIEREPHAGWGHSGRDLGYTANLFYFPPVNGRAAVTHSLLVNYGTDADSFLKETFKQFQAELLDLTLK
ncbi:serine hydrolase domain-containing protein [Terrimonas pollutisoli]|uniref:serine hydrolase domain-containing protein n=1 Tax=Terrimonas pollutisoli TaxID=3034147 RepID=UPI0023ED85EE|nr:serine hydrolase [Terrimonas sp. H1YJ31]